MPVLHFLPRAGIVFLALLAILLPLDTRAQQYEPFTISGVPVDVRAENVNLARQTALLEGQRAALQSLLMRLTSAADVQKMPRLSDEELQNLVLDVGIDQEKRSAVRYLASLSVRFKPDAVRRLLRGANIPYAEWRGRPVVVVPLTLGEDGLPPVDGANPWREAWRGSATQGVVPIQVQTAEAAEAADPVALAQRFNTQDLVVSEAVAQRVDGGKVNLAVTTHGLGPVGGVLDGVRSYQGEIGESLEMVLRRAAEDMVRSVNDGWKAGNMLQFDRIASLAVMVPLGGFEDWQALRDRLNRSTQIRAFEVAALSRGEAALVLHYVGDQQQLSQVLMQNGLVLSWADDHWMLQTVQTRPAATGR
ncbi:MAG TPA: DUF2066 domain-containing protein [Rhodospirillaceae bacterium]|nr:DUF2066 domain-containing protein [Rhodospirillaceae bacterium]